MIDMFTAVYRKSGKWWAAYVEEISGVNSQGKTLKQARANVQEALAMIFEANRQLARHDETAGSIRENLILRV